MPQRALIPAGPEGAAIRGAFLADERTPLVALAAQLALDDAQTRAVGEQARRWVEALRAEREANAGIESFLKEYDLSTPEGVLLMCVAEALLRIPDAATADAADSRQAGAAATGSRISANPPRCWSTHRPGA